MDPFRFRNNDIYSVQPLREGLPHPRDITVRPTYRPALLRRFANTLVSEDEDIRIESDLDSDSDLDLDLDFGRLLRRKLEESAVESIPRWEDRMGLQ